MRVGGGSFFGCTSLGCIKIPANVILDSDFMFTNEGFFEKCTGLKELEIDCKNLPQVSFCECSSLTTIIFGENCESLGSGCFENCINIVNLTIPTSITGIGSSCFSGCSSLKSIRIPESVKLEETPTGWTSGKFYGEFMFRNCTSLEEVDWNANVIPIGAFGRCVNLKSLTIGSNTSAVYLGRKHVGDTINQSFEYYTFDETNIVNLKVYGSVDLLSYYSTSGGVQDWTNRLNYTFDIDKLLRLFANVETLYVGGSIGKVDSKKDYYYESLKDLIIETNSYSCGLGIRWSKLQSLKSTCLNPPYIPNSFSTEQYTTMEVEVPSEALEAYKNASVWRNFWNIIGYTGLNEVSSASEKVITGRFDISGSPVDENFKGLVIVRYSDGTVKKCFKN